MEASALPVPAGLARARLTIGGPLLRLRSDDQLVALFRSGNNEAFRVIHDRYRQRLFAYTRQMLPGSRQDAEDALQDVFVRAFGGLRSNDRELALRAWLYRIAHNRCIDELRRPAPPAPEVMELVRPPGIDPIHAAEQRESLRRLIEDVRRLPDQQRSALLMRELGGMSYSEVAAALEVSVPAVKSLLVRARVSLARALEAREASCIEIREDLIFAHDRGVRPTGMARRHMRDCEGCREFRGEMRGTSKQFAALLPLGPAAGLAKLLGIGGGAGSGAAAGTSAAGGGATIGTGAAAAGGIFGAGGAVASVGAVATGAGHVATLLAAAVVAAGGAVEIQHQIAPAHHAHHHAVAVAVHRAPPASTPTAASSSAASVQPSAPVAPAPISTAAASDPAPAPAAARPHRHRVTSTRPGAAAPTHPQSQHAVWEQHRRVHRRRHTGRDGHGHGHRRLGDRDRRPERHGRDRRLNDRHRNRLWERLGLDRHRRRRHDRRLGQRDDRHGWNRQHSVDRDRPLAGRLGPRRHDTAIGRHRHDAAVRRDRNRDRYHTRHELTGPSTATSRSSTTRRCSSGAGAALACTRSLRSTRRSAGLRSAAAGCGSTTTRASHCAMRSGCRGR